MRLAGRLEPVTVGVEAPTKGMGLLDDGALPRGGPWRRQWWRSEKLLVALILGSSLIISAWLIARSYYGEQTLARLSTEGGFVPAHVDRDKVIDSCRPKPGAAAPRVVFVTGSAGFIGFHTALYLRNRGDGVVGLDNFNDYYPPALKRARAALLDAAGVHTVEADLNDGAALRAVLAACRPTHVLHLAAQAGVRYAAKNPGAYVASNVAGFVSLMEAVRGVGEAREGAATPAVVYASSSSIYGLNTKVPFSEADVTERPASLYAATKKADELMAHTYNYIYGISVTGLRFFTVYGPWGRPDMAAFSFSRAITMGKAVRIFQGPNGVELSRDFTFIDDIVLGTVAALDTAQPSAKPAPPPRVYNLGNTHPVNVTTFVSILEQHLGSTALREYVAVPGTGDVLFTHADVSLARAELGYAPSTSLAVGLGKFVSWFLEYYKDGAHAGDLDHIPMHRRLE